MKEERNSSTSRIRVLHVEAGTYFGGSHKALATYLKASNAPNLEHHVLLVHSVPELEADLAGTCPIAKLPSVTYGQPSGKIAIIKFWAGLTWRIWRLLSGSVFDLVHVNNTFIFQPYTVLASKLAGLPVVAHVRNPVSESRLARIIASWVQSIITVNAALARSVRKWSTTDVRICYDGVELGIPDLEAAARLRRDLLGSGTVLIGSVGRLESQKGYDVLIEAAKYVIAAHPCVRFVVAGDGPLLAQLEKRRDELGLTNEFRFCGFQSDVATFLQAVDVFVCPSRYEGGPMTVAEALLVSKPVVSTSVGFVPELTLDGQYADLAPVEDVPALVSAIQSAMARTREESGRAAQGRDQAIEYTDPLRSAKRIDDVLSAVGQQARGGRR